MNFFEPPADVRSNNEPVTLKRLAWSVSRGVLLGGGLAAALFALAWTGELFERQAFDPWFVAMAFTFPLGALELWSAAKAFRSNRVLAWLFRAVAVALGVGAAVYVLSRFFNARMTDWAQAHPEFVTLVVVCLIVGLLAVRGGLRLWFHHRGRAVLWFTAAVALWFSGEWSVKLGAVQDAWNDPGAELAFNTVIASGALALIGVLALMDWNIRRREAQDTVEGASSERNGLNNG